MKKEYNYLSLLIVSILLFQACNENITDPEYNPKVQVSAELTELEKYLVPLNSSNPESSTDDLLTLNSIGEARIIGLGEATHGTKEFFQLKHKIFRYLVENHGIRVLAFEAGMGESIYINRYVQGEDTDLTELMLTKMLYGVWRTKEVRELIEWMRTYNEDKPDSEKLHYIGVDSQDMYYQPDLVEEYIEGVQPSLLQETQDVMGVIRSLGPPWTLYVRYENMEYDQYKVITDTLTYLIDRMDEFKDNMITNSSHYEFQTHRQLVRNLLQTHIEFHPRDRRLVSYRDQFMALNTLWISTLLENDPKIAVWAHNGHVHVRSIAMGNYLRNEIGDDYKAIGFSFSKGSFGATSINMNGRQMGWRNFAITEEPLKNSLNAFFHSAKEDNFILNLDEIPETSLLIDYFNSLNRMLMLGGTYVGVPSYYYMPISVMDEYNAMIYVDVTTAAEHLTP